ncbi:MAG: hypothetical protein ABIP03_05275 [Aquihabitans sp.]
MPRLFRRHWTKTEAKLIDQRFSKFTQSDPPLQRWEYMVELPGPDGEQVRLAFEEYLVKVDLPPVGQMVPVLVNRDCTKAMFDVHDPRIDRSAKAGVGIAAEAERFRKKLGERG